MNKTIIKTVCLAMAAVSTAAALTFSGSSAASESVSRDNAFISGEDTMYSIGSVSKVYVTAAAMQLAEQGLIDIEEPVAAYIPGFTMADERYKDITVHMLMNHTSGLMGTTDINHILFDDVNTDWEDDFLALLAQQRLKAAPGAQYNYCNDGFSLLQLVVEHVSGMDFTDYITEKMMKPLECVQTGSGKNIYRDPRQVTVYDYNGRPFPFDYESGIGAGGIISTAAEVCRFGASFFKGDNTLLSEKSKSKMAEDEAEDIYGWHYGNGWDCVDFYDDTDVKVLSKNGALINQFAELMVAPDEKISVAVCSTGGDANCPTILAKNLMDIALTEKGIDVSGEEKVFELSDTVPEEYKAYEGIYMDSDHIVSVTFPDMKYMKAVMASGAAEKTYCFCYTKDGKFVRMLGDVSDGIRIVDEEEAVIEFIRRSNGRVYLAASEESEYQMLGSIEYADYKFEKSEPETPDPAADAAWAERTGRYYLTSKKYSSYQYHVNPVLYVKYMPEFEGYIFVNAFQKIKDSENAGTNLELPGAGNRDISDTRAYIKDECEYIESVGKGETYIREDCIPVLKEDMSEVIFDERSTKWFIIDGSTGGAHISFDRTEHTAVYIYDKYDNLIYSTFMSGYGDSVTLPKSGKIVFIGESGERTGISLKK